MSLLNDVLRDLDARGAAEAGPALKPVPRPVPAVRRSAPFVLGALVALFTVAGGVLLLRKPPPAPQPRTGEPAVAASLHPDGGLSAHGLSPPEPARGPSPRPLGRSSVPHAPPAKGPATVGSRPGGNTGLRPEPPPLAAAPARPARPLPLPTPATSRVASPFPAQARAPGVTAPRILPDRTRLRREERRALALARSGDLARAWALVTRASPRHPGRHPGYLRIEASLAAATARWGRAARLYARLCRLDPRSARAWAGRGLSLAARGEKARARRALRRALALGVANPSLRRYLRRELLVLGPPPPPHEHPGL